MPTYQYACTECGHSFEQVQSFSESSLTECPQCQGRLRKVFNAVGVVFKGSGFYRNDSRSTPGSIPDTSSSESSSTSGEKSDKAGGEKTSGDKKSSEAGSGEKKSAEKKPSTSTSAKPSTSSGS